MALLVKRSLLMPAIHGSNPIIGQIIPTNCINRKDKRKEKEVLILMEEGSITGLASCPYRIDL